MLTHHWAKDFHDESSGQGLELTCFDWVERSWMWSHLEVTIKQRHEERTAQDS